MDTARIIENQKEKKSIGIVLWFHVSIVIVKGAILKKDHRAGEILRFGVLI